MTELFRRLLLLAVSAVAVAAIPAGARAATYDGNWSLLVITENGTCDRAYRYPIRVKNGTVNYEGEAGIDVSGKVSPDGKVNASVRRGEQNAKGTGRLADNSGSGTWTGRSPTSACSGRWEAERRSAQ